MPRLPDTYQEVEYIEGTGTQYLDTGVSAPNGFKAKLRVLITAQVAQTLIGSHNVNTPYGRNNVNTFTVGSTWGLHMNDEMINSLGSINIGKIYEIEGCTILGASYLTVDGVRLTTGTNTSPMSSNNILLLQNQYSLNHGYGCNKAKIYSCEIYDNSLTLIRDLVPCYRKSDGVIGMYDLVNDQFYTNSGTGTFIKGDDVLYTGKIQKMFIWQSGIEYQIYPPSSHDREPTASTIIYYPLNSTYTTQNLGTLGSSYNLANGGVTFDNYGGYFNGSSALIASTMLPDATQYTVAFWCKPQATSGRSVVLFDGSSTSGHDFGITCNLSDGIELWCKDGGMSYFKPTGWDSSWHCVVYTISTSGINLYIDNQLVNSGTGSIANVGYHYYMHIGEFDDGATHNYWRYIGYLSDIVLDTNIWDANTIGAYYDTTKRDGEYVLFTETDLANNGLGLFSAETTSWKGKYSRTLASITNDGQGNYYYQTAPRTPVCLRLRGNYPTLMSIQSGYTNRKVKVVYDYLCIAGNSSQGACGRYNRDSSYGPCLSSSGNTNRGAADANVVYTAEIIMDVGANTESGSIFLKSDGSKVRDFGPNTMPTATSGTYYENDCWLGYGTDTENIGIRLGDIHIFTYDY